MPGMDGFGVLRRLAPERVPVTIFVTAHDQHALRALNASAVDYLLKPFTRARFAQALGRAKILCRAKDLDLSQHAAQWTSESTKIAVRRGRTMLWIQVAEIDWIEAANNYICLHCGSRSDIVRETLQNVEQRLGPARFLRIHRSILVNRDAVRELHPSANGDAIVVLRDGTSLHASRTYRRQLLL
jgi:two-component system LytT family response regulator